MKGSCIYKATILGLSVVITLLTTGILHAQAEKPITNPAIGIGDPASGVSKYAQSVFEFNYPSGWTEFTQSEKSQFKQQCEAQSRQMFQAYHGRPEGYEALVPHVFGIKAPRDAVTCVGALVRLPAQAKDYIDAMYQRSEEVFEWGKSQGKVKEIISNRKTKIGDVPVVISELLWANGDKHTVITFHFSDAPTYGGTVLIVNKNGSSKENQRQVGGIVESLVLIAPKH